MPLFWILGVFISILSPLYNLVHHFQPNYYRKLYLTVEKHNLFHSSVTSETGGGGYNGPTTVFRTIRYILIEEPWFLDEM